MPSGADDPGSAFLALGSSYHAAPEDLFQDENPVVSFVPDGSKHLAQFGPLCGLSIFGKA